MSDEVKLAERRRRALYRASYRGTKEMDWLLGRYAAAQLEAMSAPDLDAFEQLLALPDPQIEHWIMTAPEQGPDGRIGEFVRELRRFHGLDAG